jgi:HSP20 family protein
MKSWVAKMARPLALVVDDDSDVRSSLREFLARAAVNAEEAEDGVKGLDLVKLAEPDLAFLDLRLPLLDGLSLLKIAKEIRPSLPVVMMSGLPSTADILAAMEGGAYAFLTKPWNLDLLERIVSEILTKDLPRKYRGVRISALKAEAEEEEEPAAATKGGAGRMAIVRWSPFRDLMGIQQEVNRLFDDLITRRAETGAEGAVWIPAVDVSENDEAIKVKVEAPGVSKDDFKISVQNNVLTVRGEKRMEKETKEENYHRVERVYGSFFRAIELPSAVKADKVNANYKDGVLTISLPKSEEAKPKEIPVEAA